MKASNNTYIAKMRHINCFMKSLGDLKTKVKWKKSTINPNLKNLVQFLDHKG